MYIYLKLIPIKGRDRALKKTINLWSFFNLRELKVSLHPICYPGGDSTLWVKFPRISRLSNTDRQKLTFNFELSELYRKKRVAIFAKGNWSQEGTK